MSARRPDPLRERSTPELLEARERAQARLAAIDAGTAPATPDSRPNAVQLLRRIEAELSRRA